MQVKAQLISEIDAQVCWPNLMYQFSFLKCAPYVSDFRTYFPSKLKEAIPPISDAYQQYLLRSAGKADVSGDALVLSTAPLQESEANRIWKQEPAGIVELSTKANGFASSLTAKVYAYWQQPIARP